MVDLARSDLVNHRHRIDLSISMNHRHRLRPLAKRGWSTPSASRANDDRVTHGRRAASRVRVACRG